MMPEEPSVLDYVKDKLAFWKRSPRIELPVEEGDAGRERQPGDEPPGEPKPARPRPAARLRLPWGALAVLGLALLAQLMLEPQPNRTWLNGATLYLIAGAAMVVGFLRGEWPLAEYPALDEPDVQYQLRTTPLVVGVVCMVAAFLAFKGGLFTDLNLFLWLAALIATVVAFKETGSSVRSLRQSVAAFFMRRDWSIHLSPWTLFGLAAFAIAVFFRAYRLADVPPEMVSDHAEKLWDVRDVLNGLTSVYFVRNTGREFFQFYLTASIIQLFHTGLQFISLKIGTVTCGLLTLPFIYLIGKEVANRRVGMIAMIFAGIAYWPNIISRIALRFTLYPFFYAPTLYFFLRGLRTKRLRDFIFSGIFLGLGLQGYSPFRIVPILLVIGIILYIFHHRASFQRKHVLAAAAGLFVIVLISIIVFLPTLRYTLDNPLMVSFRALTRLGSVEQPIPGNPWVIFLQNLWRGLTMFAWDNGEVWVISVVHRPILDVVSAALFHLGVVMLVVRYIHKRHWYDLFTLVSIPVLLLPSVLSLAFPNENPSLNRTAGAIVPVFLIVGLALDGLLTAIQSRSSRMVGNLAAGVLVVVLLGASAAQNYDLVFNQYQTVYEQNSWNTSEVGEAVRDFAHLNGTPDTSWLIASPYWMDSRLVMLVAGYPDKDIGLPLDQVTATQNDPRAKMFIVRHFPEGTDVSNEEATTLATLKNLYPNGWAELHPSRYKDKAFWLFFVPAVSGGG